MPLTETTVDQEICAVQLGSRWPSGQKEGGDTAQTMARPIYGQDMHCPEEVLRGQTAWSSALGRHKCRNFRAASTTTWWHVANNATRPLTRSPSRIKVSNAERKNNRDIACKRVELVVAHGNFLGDQH